MDETVRDATRSSINLGIAPETNQIPDPTIIEGDAEQFSRNVTALPGHARLSPANGGQAKPATPAESSLQGLLAAKAEQPGKADPMLQPPPPFHTISAADFARGIGEFHDGAQRTSPGNAPSRAPVTPDEALFGGARTNVGIPMAVDPEHMPNNADNMPGSPNITKTSEATAPWGPPGAWSKE